MKRCTVMTLALLALTASAAAAQRPTPAPVPSPKPDDIGPKLIGTWQGTYTSDQVPPGNLKLVIAREAGVWKVTLEVISDQSPDASDVRDFTVDGNQISWNQDIGGLQCKTQVMLENGTLKGGSECSQGGGVAVTASFVLLKA
jgi:opacity protein-like surface antigen